MSDDASLQQYYVSRKRVSLDDVKRNLMLIERENNRQIPDHYYRLGQEKSFKDIEFVSQLFTVGLSRLADNYLEIRDERIYVKADQMNSWQMILPYMPPLLMICVKLCHHQMLNDGDEINYMQKYLLPNVVYTAFPSPYIPQMNDFVEDGGFSDLHMHLNGALETDLTWQDFLKNPMEIKFELDKAYGDEKVKEQYAQSSFLSDPERFYRLLRVAVVLRQLLYMYAYDIEITENLHSFEHLLQKIAEGELNIGQNDEHPMKMFFEENTPPQFLEAILYIKVIQKMEKAQENDTISGLFHYYLLILGLANKMLVQQPTCYGFEEFQKLTLNGLREYSESKNYFPRYAQLAGNQLRNIKVLEGRFSPKDRQEKNKTLIENILEGWKRLQKEQEIRGLPKSSLNLVAHFIKKREGRRDDYVRFKAFRQDIRHKADLLDLMIKSTPQLEKVILGIDAAASEFDTPPECFAPVFRHLRKTGISHFTYHAGEDFFHVLSGLRAIYEAIVYLNLQRCDRIGHATAAGVPIDLWYRNVGSRMLIREGEHLDNLIFSYYLISQSDDETLSKYLPILALKIDEYSYDIYQEYQPVSMHIKAWLERYKDPEKLLPIKDDDLKQEQRLFLNYHRKEIADRYDKIIEIDTFDVLGEKELKALQLTLLKEMHKREIVIETLPTSNVIIGNHHDFTTYHLFNWYLWKKQGYPLPPIVVGTDDTGIFATNIYNEYCNIYCQFLYEKDLNSNEIMAFLKELNANARHYGFG